MELNKNWKRVSLGEVVEELKNSIKNPIKEGYKNYIGFEHIESENLRVKKFGDLSDGVEFNKAFSEGDVLFGKIRAYLKKVAIAPFSGLCSGDILVLRTKSKNELSQELLPYILSTSAFFQSAIDSSIGTTMPRTKWQYLSKYKFPLPPQNYQTRITELFQSMETAIEHTEKQEVNLKALRKSLINNLTREKPKFGNLINGKYQKVSVGEIATEISERVDNPSKSNYEKFVGLEDFETGELRINKFSPTENLVSAMKLFKSGDVLFARRNVYLKRVSQAVFDGVCSGDAIVMRTDEKIILHEFLILILNTNDFWDYALSNAAGAFSKRIKWRELAVYSFELPDLRTQEKIVDVFNQLQTTLDQVKEQKQTLKNLKQKLLNEILG